jgi:plasmid stabilization system protein ParE
MTGYDFHPEAAIDLDEIWEFIAEDNLDAADKVIMDILAAIDALVPFLIKGTNVRTSHRARYDSFSRVTI